MINILTNMYSHTYTYYILVRKEQFSGCYVCVYAVSIDVFCTQTIVSTHVPTLIYTWLNTVLAIHYSLQIYSIFFFMCSKYVIYISWFAEKYEFMRSSKRSIYIHSFTQINTKIYFNGNSISSINNRFI